MICFALALALAEEPADDEADRAKALASFEEGSALYAQGAYQASVEAFEEAMRLSGETSLRFNIANAWERAGQLEEAKRALAAFRSSAPPEDWATLDLRLASLQSRLDARAAAEAEAEARMEAAASEVPPASTPPRKQPRWWLVGAGVGLAAGGVSLAGVSNGRAQVAYSDWDRPTYDRQRTVNQLSWTGVGLGAGLAVVGLVLKKKTSPEGLTFTF